MADDLARRLDAQPPPGFGAERRQLALDRIRQADQHDLDVALPRLEFERGRHRHMGAVIAAHAIDGNGDQRTYSASVLETTFLPR